MLPSSINIFRQTRALTARVINQVPEGDWLVIPDGFDNHIAWNVGHVIYVTQSLIYRLSGLPIGVSGEFKEMYRPGSSPAEWRSRPDIAHLKMRLHTQPAQLASDFSRGSFSTFSSYTTSTGVELDSLEDAMIFNNYHEGLHLGAIMALINLI